MTKNELIMLFKNHDGDKLELFKALTDVDRLTLITCLISELDQNNSQKNEIIFDKITYYKQSSELSTLLKNTMFEEGF